MNPTYKVLLVDDELIILSGLKFLIDWSSIGCEIIGTANNGQEALIQIDKHHPDIVICDINMPVCDGVHVLKKAYSKSHHSAFIMLTNHQEFHLVQQSLKHHAVDYILKTNLKPDVLIQSIEHGKEICNKRKKMLKIDFVEEYLHHNTEHMICECLQYVLKSDHLGDIPHHAMNTCKEATIFQHYRLLHMYIHPPMVMHYDSFTPEEKDKLFHCEKDIIHKICKNFFDHYLVLEWNPNTILVFVYHTESIDERYLSQFYKRLSMASKTVVETPIQIAITDCMDTEEQLFYCLKQWNELQHEYFYHPRDILFYNKITPQLPPMDMDISPYIHQLNKVLIAGNSIELHQVFESLIAQLLKTNLEPSKVIGHTMHLYNYTLSTIQNLDHHDAFNETFSNSAKEIDTLRSLHTLHTLIQWLEALNKSIDTYFKLTHSSYNSLIDRAREYIIDNIQQKLTLSSVSDHLNITPSYLSALFKKECQQNFVDYVNQLKINKACSLLQEKNLLIYEIAYMLGFDNAYYFTKIFRRYKGMTPKEYMAQDRRTDASNT